MGITWKQFWGIWKSFGVGWLPDVTSIYCCQVLVISFILITLVLGFFWCGYLMTNRVVTVTLNVMSCVFAGEVLGGQNSKRWLGEF